MSDVIVRRATPADAEVITGFNLAMASETEGRRLDPAVAAAAVRRVLADPSLGVYFLAEREGKVVGQLLITEEFSDWRNGRFWWIQSVYVEPGARGGGIYRALHSHVQQAARLVGDVCGLRLYVHKHNLRARQTYLSLGWQQTDYQIFEIDWSG